MKNKLSNDQNIKNLKKRENLRILIIIFSILTIIFAFADLFSNFNLLYLLFAVLSFCITVVLNKMRENTIINKKDELSDVRKEIEKNKKKFGKK